MKMTMSKLIANDIINYGMDKTINFNYIVSLDSYIDDFDDEAKQYIQDHIEEICDDIAESENITAFDYIKEDKSFDMVFGWNNLLNVNDHYVLNILRDEGIDDCFEINEIREISNQIMDDDSTRNLALEKIMNYKYLEKDL